MRVLSVRRLKGVSAWSATAAIQAVISDVPDGTVCPGHVRRLKCQLENLCVPPHLAKVGSAGRRAGRRALPTAGELAIDLAGELQFLCGEFHGTREALRASSPNTWNTVLECREFALAEACLRAAVDLVHSLYLGQEVDLAESYCTLLATAEEVSSVSSPELVIAAARERGIPVFRLGPDNAFRLSPDEVLQLGEGIHQRRLHPWGAMTDRTSYLAGHLANDKAFVKALWAQYGIPVSEGRTVTDETEAVEAAAMLDGPVVVKAMDADCGRGLTLLPSSPDEVRNAYIKAQAASTCGSAIVERYLPGAWHRLLVIEGRLVAALRREPASIIGDGEHTIRELVARANRDVRRGPDDRWPLRVLSLEEPELEALATAGLTPDSVVVAGRRVGLRISTAAAAGAESIDVTDCVHPETRALAIDAVKLLGLDIAGLDLIATDISRPLREQQGGFLEINEQPAIFMHAAPLCSPPRPVGEAIVESLFPLGHSGRVPLVVFIGGQLASRAAAALAEKLARTSRGVGLSTPEETRLDVRNITPLTSALPERLELLLRHPRTELAVVSAPLQDVLHSGLGTDRCTVLVLAEGSGAKIGDDHTHDETSRLVRRLIAAARRCVANTQDTNWQPWITIGSLDVCLVGSHDDESRICDHLKAGGVAAFFEPAGIIYQTGGRQPQFFPAGGQMDDDGGPDNPLARALATAAWISLTRIVGTTGEPDAVTYSGSRTRE